MRMLLLLALCLSASAAAERIDWPSLGDELRDELDDAVDGRRAAGMALVVVHRGEIELAIAGGVADRDSDAPFTVDTSMPVGDLSRLLTAALALRLADRGDWSIDDRVLDRAPALRFDGDASAMTLRHLLTHRSGLAPNWLAGMFVADQTSPLPAVLPMSYAPGLLSNTSNLGYAAIGTALESAAGVSYAALLQRELIEPLGLTDTGIDLRDVARAHRKGDSLAPLRARDAAALGIVSSARDLARLLLALDENSASDWLSADARRQMVTAQNADAELDVGNLIGIGWELAQSTRPGVGLVAVQSSSYPNYRAEIRWLPQHRLGVIALANWREAFEPIDELVATTIDRVLERDAGIAPRDPDEPLPASVPLPAGARASSFAKHYATPLGMMVFAPEGERFDLRFLGFDFRADRRGDGWWGLRFRLLGLLPLSVDAVSRVLIRPVELAGRQSLLAFADDRFFLFGSAVSPPEGSFDDLVGRYRLTNPDALTEQLEIETLDVEIVDGIPVLAYELPFVLTIRPQVALAPLDNNRFAIAGFGPNLGDALTVSREQGRVRISYSGYVVDKVD